MEIYLKTTDCYYFFFFCCCDDCFCSFCFTLLDQSNKTRPATDPPPVPQKEEEKEVLKAQSSYRFGSVLLLKLMSSDVG